jgi:hypothetical protein
MSMNDSRRYSHERFNQLLAETVKSFLLSKEASTLGTMIASRTSAETQLISTSEWRPFGLFTPPSIGML